MVNGQKCASIMNSDRIFYFLKVFLAYLAILAKHFIKQNKYEGWSTNSRKIVNISTSFDQ